MGASVPRLFPDQTIVCLASGPSLTSEDVDFCRGRAPVVAVNDTYRLAPWAAALYACDARWWESHAGVPSFMGLKFALESKAAQWPGVQVLDNTGDRGVELEPTGLRTGKNSGYQAVNLAVHLGAARIVLLGYDMQTHEGQPSHFFGEHPRPLRRPSPFAMFCDHFASLVEPLRALKIDVINCSRASALACFPRRPLGSVL